MLPIERKKRIIEYIADNKPVRVISLSEEFDVTKETVRRDLEKLEQEGVLLRTYGGAVPVEEEHDDEPFSVRSRENIEGKKGMGQAISDLIEDGEVIIMDSSTTSLEIAKTIGRSKNVTMITNSMGLSMEMVKYDKVQIISAGGTLRKKSLSFIGPNAKKTIKNYYADKVVLSCKGICKKRGIMDSNEMEAEIKKSMMEAASTVILAVDQSKFNKCSSIRFADLSKVDIIVTDKEPPEEWLRYLEDNKIQLIIA